MTLLPMIANSTLFLYASAALLPAIVLLVYVYKKDTVEKEPASLLVKLLFGGLLATVAAFVLEFIAEYAGQLFLEIRPETDVQEYAMMSAMSTAIIEECAKYFFLKKYSWKHPAFNYKFDGIIYAVFVSLGFAAVENILYVFLYGGIEVALPRALLAIPAHLGFSVCMGLFYGNARLCANRLDAQGAGMNLLAGVLGAIVMHAVYDGTIMVQTEISSLMFYAFVVIMYIFIFRTLKNESRKDHSIKG